MNVFQRDRDRHFLRAATPFVIGLQLFASMPVSLLAATPAEPAPAPILVVPPVMPVPVAVNRSLPNMIPVSVVTPLTNSPSDDEVGLVRVFPQRIVPITKAQGSVSAFFQNLMGNQAKVSPQADNAAVAVVLNKLAQSTDSTDTTVLQEFVSATPNSRWAPALRQELARRQFKLGMFTQAIAGWESLWTDLKDSRDGSAVAIADEVLGNLLDAYIGMGRADKLSDLIGAQEPRPGNATLEGKVMRAKQSVWLLKHKGAQNVMCGPLALYCIQNFQGKAAGTFDRIPLNSITDDFIATGISLTGIRDYADKYQLGLVMKRRTAGAAIPTPAVMHLASGHFSAILEEKDGQYFLEDRSMRFSGWVSLQTLESQASGAFLVPASSTVAGWQAISDKEGATIFGRDGLHGIAPTGTSVTNNSQMVGGDQKCDKGMPYYTFHPQVASVRIEDTPVGYAPPVGPAVNFKIAYNDLDDSKPISSPTFSNVGRIWSIDWVAYVDHISTALSASSVLTVHVRGGGVETSKYNTTTTQFGPDDRGFATVKRTGTATYTRTYSDGSQEVYDAPDNPSAPNRVFLTKQIDPRGNFLTFSYDSNMRLVAVTDSLGQVTTLEYTLGTDIWKVTKVTDPFGRFATMTYSDGELSGVTDLIGLASSFVYDSAEFITSMTTPYGTTTFAKILGTVSQPWNRTVTVTDPQGAQEQVQYVEPIDVPQTGASIPGSVVVNGAAVSFTADYGRQHFRNSFYWSKKAMKEAPGDISKARNYRWFTDTNYVVLPILEAVKEPFEDRVWFNYPLMSGGAYSGTGSIPQKVLRMLPGAVPQLTQNYYNSLGRTTSAVTPLGRTTTYTYATNQIDLLQVNQTTSPTTSEVLAKFTYNTLHLPLTVTDAAGQKTTITYNPKGQPLTITNAKSEVTAFAYNASGYLTSIDGPLAGTADTTSLTYDGFGRPNTVTNPDGYVVAVEYDAMDRVTKVTYPDATFEQFTYDRLDRSATRDRLGRLTTYQHNSLRQLVQVQDALNQITRYDWCRCGDLWKITDPLGRITAWSHDVQGRKTAKKYADGSTINYIYESNTSRLARVDDEKGQSTVYTYDLEDRVTRLAYPNATVATASVNYVYDPIYPRVTSMTDGMGATTYAYNPIAATPAIGAGQLASIDGPLTNDTITFQYDQLGRTVSHAINAVSSAVTFDAAGRVSAATNNLGAFSYGFDGVSSRVASVSYPNGQSSALSYFDNLGDRRLQRIANTKGTAPISQFDYTYDAAGQIATWSKQADISVAPTSYTFGYDGVKQLKSAVLNQGATVLKTYNYSYDKSANLTTIQTDDVTQQLSYNALNELTTATGPATAATYEWDAKHQLTALVQGTSRSEFSYDGLGRRVRIVEKTNGVVSSDKRFVWCGLEICEERDSTGATVQKRFFGQGVNVLTGATAGKYFYTRDHLGSIRELTDASGVVRARYDYDPYGRSRKMSGDRDADFGYTGHYVHSPSGLVLAPYRAYNPDTGRWLSRDPIEEEGGLNLFGYVLNDPINGIDPLGLSVMPGFPDPNQESISESFARSDLMVIVNWISGRKQHPNAYRNSNTLTYGVVPFLPGSINTRGAGAVPCRRVTNPKHHPNSKSPEPKNVDELYKKSVSDQNGVRWAKDDAGIIHRFTKPSNGETHWNGSTGGNDPIKPMNLPSREILKQL